MQNFTDKYPISVVLPVYKKDDIHHLKTAIRSIELTKIDELVICFDGDGCLEHWRVICEILKSASFKFVAGSSVHANGLGNNLNFGMTMAGHDVITRFDSDDIWLPNRLEAIKNLDFNFADIVAFSVEEFENEPGDLFRFRTLPDGFLSVSHLEKRNLVNHMAVCFSKKRILEVNGYRNVIGFEDYDLWLRCLRANFKLLGSSKVITLARTNKQFISRRSGFKYSFRECLFFIRSFREGLLSISSIPFWVIRVLSRLLPNWTLNLIYRKVLR